jgi:tRNA (guanine-N7-)-methyltransferase
MGARRPLLDRDGAPVGGGFHGRGQLKKLSPRREALRGDLLDRLRVPAGPIVDPTALFAHRPARITLEIGFGGGEHLVARACERPDEGFIGVEPFVNGMAKALAAIAERGIGNVRLFDRDAAELLPRLPDASLDAIDVLYPDPWPKRRHHKRRFVNAGSIAEFHRLLKPGGRFRFASDIDDYVGWTLAHIHADARFRWTAARAADWTEPYPGWPGTRYEAKAKREGRVPSYLSFEKAGART